jgi:hypothetical protein
LFRIGPRRQGWRFAAPKTGAPLTAPGRCEPAPLWKE